MTKNTEAQPQSDPVVGDLRDDLLVRLDDEIERNRQIANLLLRT